jgi:putative transposase
VVRETVEETLNKLLDAETGKLYEAKRYEHSNKRIDARAGHYERNFDTTAGKVKLKVPELRTISFESATIDRYRRRETSVEEALMERYLAGVSVRRVFIFRYARKAEYWENRQWFESNLPVPPFYESENMIKAITWF